MADFTNRGAFVPTTDVWDVSEIYSTDVNSEEFKELLVRLYQNINKIALSLNIRDAGYYVDQEFVNGQLFFPDPLLNSQTSQNPVFRQVFRKVVNFGVLPNNATKSAAHAIVMNTNFSFTRIYGCASDTGANIYLPIPYASGTGANIIELNVDGTNVNVITNSNRTNFDTTYIILEYIKN